MMFEDISMQISLKLCHLEVLPVLKIYLQPFWRQYTKSNLLNMDAAIVCRLNDSYFLVLLNGTQHYNSIQEWASWRQEETRHTCTICNKHVFIKYGFEVIMPSLFVFEFSNQALHIDLLINVQLKND